MITDNRIVFLTIICAFLFFMGLSYVYTIHYGTPFGMSDIDRYLCMMQRPSFVEDCRPVDAYTFFTHFYVFFLLSGLSNQMINYVTNLFVWILLPLSFYIFSREFLENKDNAIHSVLYLMFGTYIYFFFGYMMLLAQLTSFIFYLLSLAFLTEKNYKKAVIFTILAFIGHPYIVGIYVLYFLSIGIHNKNYKIVFLSVLALVFLASLLNLDFLTVFNSERPQPTLYDVFFLFTNPLLSLFFFIGLNVKKPDVNHIFTLLLLLVCPFTNLSRGLPFLHVMMAVYSYMGLKHLMKNTRNGRFIELVFLMSMLLHFLNMFSFFNNNMIIEMPLRGIDPTYFKSILGLI